jgi:hypothetical protein
MRIPAVVFLLALLPGAALANDSTAELANGGLVFTRSPDVEMRSEDLFISADEIRVGYVFFNGSGRDVTSLVAFPMPDIRIESDSDNIAVPTEDPENILAFSTVADGRPVAARAEQKAYAGGAERTALLRRLGVPLAPHLRATQEALDRVPRPEWDELVRLGLAEIVEYDDTGAGMRQHLAPRWLLKTAYHWQQTFPAGRETRIEHRYRPSVGQSVGTSLGSPGAVTEAWFRDYQRKYCLDRDFLATVERAKRAAPGSYGAPFSEQRIDYVLKTGANWAGPIRDFRLVVDKGEPSNLVSFCGVGVRKISSTRFEVRTSDFTPSEDLHVLILGKPP